MKKGCLAELIAEIKQKNNIPDEVKIPENTIHQGLKRGPVSNSGTKGYDSSLLLIKPTLIATIIQMARMRQCITPAQGISLVNSLIGKKYTS